MNEVFKLWIQAQEDLARAKSTELELRHQVLKKLPGELGTETHNFPEEGIGLKITRGVTRKIDEAVLDSIMDDLSDREVACINYKPSLDTKAYNQLDERSILKRAVTVKPSLPSIKVVEIDGD